MQGLSEALRKWFKYFQYLILFIKDFHWRSLKKSKNARTFKYLWEPWAPTVWLQWLHHCKACHMIYTEWSWNLQLQRQLRNNIENNLLMRAQNKHVAAIFFSLLSQHGFCLTSILQSKAQQTKMFLNEMTNSTMHPTPLITWIKPSYNKNATWYSTSVTHYTSRHQHLSFTFNMLMQI